MNVLLFGATGMVGQAVLRECIADDGVTSVVAVGRSASGVSDPKLRDVVCRDMFDTDLSALPKVMFDACFFCLGVSSAGMNEADYTRLTFDLTMAWARPLATLNSSMAFLYVSGAGTGGKSMWARVKGRTESGLLGLFPAAYMIRLGALVPTHGERSKTTWTRVSYAVFRPVIPMLRRMAPGAFISTEELGRAMIRVARERPTKHILEMRDLLALGRP